MASWSQEPYEQRRGIFVAAVTRLLGAEEAELWTGSHVSSAPSSTPEKKRPVALTVGTSARRA